MRLNSAVYCLTTELLLSDHPFNGNDSALAAQIGVILKLSSVVSRLERRREIIGRKLVCFKTGWPRFRVLSKNLDKSMELTPVSVDLR